MRYVPEVEQVEFYVNMPEDSAWIGLALGHKDMTFGGDMAVFFSNKRLGDEYAYGDYNSDGFGEPIPDRSNDLKDHPEGVQEIAGGRRRMWVRRDLDTGDPIQDFVIPLDQEFDIGYSMNDQYGDLSPYTPH